MNNRYDCARVQEELSALADDAIPEEAAAHLAGCDDCRDLLHDARLTASALRHSLGADFAPMDGDALAAKVLAAIDGAAKATREAPAPRDLTPQPPLRWLRRGRRRLRPRGAGGDSPPPESRLPPHATKREGTIVARRRIGASILGVGLFAAAASVAVVVVALRGPSVSPPDAPDQPRVIPSGPVGPWHATLGRVLGAGVTVKADGASDFAAVRERAVLAVGSTIRTDARTRARLDLDDGTVLVLDRGTTVVLDPGAPRRARIVEGTLVADVAHRDDAPPAVHHHRAGRRARARDQVRPERLERAHDGAGHPRRGAPRRGPRRRRRGEDRPGGRARPRSGHRVAGRRPGRPRGVVGAQRPDEATTSSGLGELRARRPGSSVERDEAVHLAEHSVRVRIVGNVARTEIEEVFRNDTGRELEGLYRFPLPPEAQVEELALDVDGRMEPGAFVDRDRAAAIWRGVIHHAAPNTPPPREEYVWVPGPWRDPALLEWQRGGRFELRVFPIPARGARRVRIAYTQTIAPSGGGARRYVYPLPHDPAGSTRVDHMSMDVQVLGHASGRAVRMLGYPFAAAETSAAASRWTFSQDNFTPSGDVVLEYALGDQDVPVTAWGYAEPTNTEGAYVALALRPQLPRWGEARPRDYVFVVDASRSMVGERYARATRLLTSIVSEMDRRDRLTVLACDVRCVAMREGMVPASAEVARQVGGWLQAREPAGGSDLGAALRAAVSATRATPDDRDVRVVYLGDGASTVGHRRPSTLALEVTTALPGAAGDLHGRGGGGRGRHHHARGDGAGGRRGGGPVPAGGVARGRGARGARGDVRRGAARPGGDAAVGAGVHGAVAAGQPARGLRGRDHGADAPRGARGRRRGGAPRDGRGRGLRGALPDHREGDGGRGQRVRPPALRGCAHRRPGRERRARGEGGDGGALAALPPGEPVHLAAGAGEPGDVPGLRGDAHRGRRDLDGRERGARDGQRIVRSGRQRARGERRRDGGARRHGGQQRSRGRPRGGDREPDGGGALDARSGSPTEPSTVKRRGGVAQAPRRPAASPAPSAPMGAAPADTGRRRRLQPRDDPIA